MCAIRSGGHDKNQDGRRSVGGVSSVTQPQQDSVHDLWMHVIDRVASPGSITAVRACKEKCVAWIWVVSASMFLAGTEIALLLVGAVLYGVPKAAAFEAERMISAIVGAVLVMRSCPGCAKITSRISGATRTMASRPTTISPPLLITCL